MREIDNFYLEKEDSVKDTLMALRSIILAYHDEISESWKYKMPVFCFKGKMFCYLWVQKKSNVPYIGIVEGGKIAHPLLIQEKRARMKIMLIDPTKDLPVKAIYQVFKLAMVHYTTR